MATTTETILKVGTEEAVKNVADLRDNIKILKENLKLLEKTQSESDEKWQEYQKTLSDLKENQNALKDSMYATSGSFTDVVKSAKGASDSYNSLVHQMAKLKEEFRSTNDVARRNELGIAINDINSRLKEMDALQGNFQRNVGNYQSAFKGMAGNVDALDKALKVTAGNLGAVKGGFEAISSTPAIATFGLLLNVVMQLADRIKENEGVLNSIKKVMATMQPVMDMFSGILEKIADVVANLIGKAADFLGNSGIFNKMINGVMGVGNAIVKYITAPFKGVIEAIKVFQDEGIKGLRNAGKAFLGEMKEGISFKQNFQAGEALAETIISGAKSKTKETKEAGKDMAFTMKEGYDEAWDDIASDDETYKMFHKELEERKKIEEQAKKDRLAAEKEFRDEQVKIAEDAAKEYERIEKEKADADQKRAEEKIATQQAVVSATQGILNALADIYESDSKNSEKNAKKIKAMRIADATIDTIAGAIGAFTSAARNPGGVKGMIIGAANAAAVTAMGLANIAKIKNTNISSSSTSSSSSSSATATAPSYMSDVASVRNVTSASEEQRLNDMAKDQRVYILSSDIQASNYQTKVQVAESSF